MPPRDRVSDAEQPLTEAALRRIGYPGAAKRAAASVVDELLENFPGPSFNEKFRALVSIYADARVPAGDEGVRTFVRAAQNIRDAHFVSREGAATRLRELLAMAPAPLAYVVDTNTVERRPR